MDSFELKFCSKMITMMVNPQLGVATQPFPTLFLLFLHYLHLRHSFSPWGICSTATLPFPSLSLCRSPSRPYFISSLLLSPSPIQFGRKMPPPRVFFSKKGVNERGLFSMFFFHMYPGDEGSFLLWICVPGGSR